MKNEIVSFVIFRNGLIFSSTLILLSLFAIIWLSKIFFSEFDPRFKRYSSILSPFFKHLFPNAAIAAVLVISAMGIVYTPDFFKVAFLAVLVIIYPVTLFFKSVIILANDFEVAVYDYSGSFTFKRSQIKKVNKVQLGLLYQIRYENSNGSLKSLYFFPVGGFLMFNEPEVVKSLKGKIQY
jgi:hypothetical protein